ncbi:RNA polymerase sigma factor [Cohnella kolymensis]|uniref:RNA polymerase sigma factor n=1 Tax=Cohnella kolymensis TaxID=1590652 RepID=UPI0006984C2D|nr:RNA polymerase sigma factor [Cohnella kolymensis]
MNVFQSVEPFIPRLKLYCHRLAGNEWDAEDLMQEVLTKVYRSLQQSPNREFGYAFLFLIAKNTWIDHCRKHQTSGVTSVFNEDMHPTTYTGLNELQIRELLEQLADQLNSRQMVLILMMDIFKFSAAETAELLSTTVGAVKEGLKRARHRLRALATKSREGANKIKLEAEISGIYSFTFRDPNGHLIAFFQEI